MIWIDEKGRKIEISSMSDRWLNNIRKYFKDGGGKEKIQPVLDEIKRRKKKRRE